jgi:hypothetical protein
MFVLCAGAIQAKQRSAADEDSELNNQARIVFGKLLHSDQDAKIFVNLLYVYRLNSPWSYETILQVSQRLIVAGYEQGEVLPLLKSCGDGAVGVDAQADDEDFARLVGLMFSLRNEPDDVAVNVAVLERYGIPAYKFLSEALGMKKEKIEKLAEANRLRSKVVYQILLESNEVHFGDLATKIAKERKQ